MRLRNSKFSASGCGKLAERGLCTVCIASLCMSEEDSVVEILSKIEDNASNQEMEHVLYEFRGLLSKKVNRVRERPIVSCYCLLRESPEYHSFALSLAHFIIDDVKACGKEFLVQILTSLQTRCARTSQIQIPKLRLRCTLSAIARRLSKEEVDQFVCAISEVHLQVHPDRFGDSYQMLKLFEIMEERHLLKDKLQIVRETLHMINRLDVAQNIVDTYDPNKFITVAAIIGRAKVHEPLCLDVSSAILDVSNGRSLSTSESELDETLKSIVLKHSTQIQQFLNFCNLLPLFTNPHITFLTQDELHFVMKPHTDFRKANNLLQLLIKKPICASRKFVVCLWLAREHLGHEDLFCMLWPSLPNTEVHLITEMCQQLSYASSIPIDTPPAFSKLQGDLTRRSFEKVVSLLWDNFSKGNYQTLAKITSRLKESPCLEWSIVGKWFNAMNCVFVHHCKDHNYCITNVLEPALEQCKHPSVLNQNILEGRIRLRLAQVYLLTGNKSKAIQNSEKARQLLSLTCGYDVAKLLLREAKVISATQPHRKVEIESMYLAALQNFDEAHICCRPTVHLSLAAFYLNFSFSTKPDPELALPIPSQDELKKAKGQLEALDRLGLFLPSMRNCERNILMAEILRLEEKFTEAEILFSKTEEESHKSGLLCLVAISEHRRKTIKESKMKTKFLDQLLSDINEDRL